MEDPNLIACLFPAEDEQGYALSTITSAENDSRYVPRRQDAPYERDSRESTATPDDEQTPDYHRSGLYLTFDQGPKAGPGFVFGTDRNRCDIVLPKLNGISHRHCLITFDSRRRLILRDVSRHGTTVTYNRKGGEKRNEFTWILGGHEFLSRRTTVLVKVHELVTFQVVAEAETRCDLYIKNVDRFLEAGKDELPVGRLGIQSNNPTAAPSGSRTPQQAPILLKRQTLGKGAFSVVNSVWDVSTGHVYASKKFHDVRRSDWQEEASLMKKISHEHIVRIVFAIETPSPRLILEYLPLGNLDMQHCRRHISENEVLTVLCHSLAGLSYLHELDPPIVHRDIKPENILVQSRDPLYIKLADFGLSKASEYLTTLCGTAAYVAPEIAKYIGQPLDGVGESPKYTSAVDMWSLGVVIFKYAYNLPSPGQGGGIHWCEKIVNELHGWDFDDLLDVLSVMLIVERKSRLSAREAWRRAVQIPLPGGCSTPTQASRDLGQLKDVRNAEDQGIKFPADSRSTSPPGNPPNFLPSSEIPRYIWSDRLPPVSNESTILAETRKRPMRPSKQSSASVERRTKRRGEDIVASYSGGRRQRATSEPGVLAEHLERHVQQASSGHADEQLGADYTNAARPDQDDRGPLAERAWTDSEGHIAARLLYALREA